MYSNRAYHVIQLTGLFIHVVLCAAGLDVLVVGTAIQHHVALQGDVGSVGVVSSFVSVKLQVAIVDLHLPTQLPARAVLLLLPSLDRDVLTLGGGRRRRGRRKQLAGN